MKKEKSFFAMGAALLMVVHLFLLLFGETYFWWNYPLVGASVTDLFNLFGLIDDENNAVINAVTRILTLAPVITLTAVLFLTVLNRINAKVSHTIIAICFGIPSLCFIANIINTLMSYGLSAYDSYISFIPLISFLIMIFMCITMLTRIKLNRVLNIILGLLPAVIYLCYYVLIEIKDYYEFHIYYGSSDGRFDWYWISENIKSIVMIPFLLFMGLYFIKAYSSLNKQE